MPGSRRLLSLALVCLMSLAARADDWPQYGGPRRDGVSTEAGLRKAWAPQAPMLLWTFDNLGTGYSGPAVVGDRLYVSCARGDSEFLIALDLKDPKGPKELWATRIGATFTWKGNSWNLGPNASPSVDDARVYALGGFGDLICVDAATGKELWRKNLPTDLGGEVNPIGGGLEEPTPLGWGYASAPLVDGDQLLCIPGGKKGLMATLNKKTGDLIWQSKEVTDQAPYSSPILAEIGGIKQYILAINSGTIGIAAKDGKRVWSYRRQPAYDDVVVATPIVHNDFVFSTVGFGQGCDLVKLKANVGAIEATRVYSNKTIQARNGGVVLVDGHLYGYSEGRGWVCVELETGKVKWADRDSLERGSVTAVNGMLICIAEKGGVVALVEATPAARREVGRFSLPKESTLRRPSGGLWTHAIVANGKMYVRDQEFLFCYDLK